MIQATNCLLPRTLIEIAYLPHAYAQTWVGIKRHNPKKEKAESINMITADFKRRHAGGAITASTQV